ncbi:MAG: LacI family DNA-binding transcriptional regulator [Burkholderiales bacterium]
MANKRVTILDVAKAAGVHASTVSRALNSRTSGVLTDEVAERVRAAARALGYSPDAVAASLRTRRSSTVGVLIPDIANPVFPPILRGIESVLAETGYTAIIANTDNDPRRAVDALERFAARRLDGVILATIARGDPSLERCRHLGLPAVLVNRSVEDGRVSAVVNDDEAGIALAVQHLADLGHRAIGHVAGPRKLSTGLARRAGFIDALKARDLGGSRPAIAEARAFDVAGGAQAAAALLSAHRQVTAIVAANDLLALGCYDELAQRGLACPGNVSVTGFNDMPFADRFAPPLTTVRIPHRMMGTAAARLLLAEIEDTATPKQKIRLQPELVIRRSTAPPRRRR